ncbi:hypothetical protein [Burkholderia ambifaria]|uniref:Uncharacterized protein n=1 Tax=Burkholderia ambifaria MEX-5 TaxID=396597 RepID=B1T378_9BURK|nr:hypothetical protein [Burkholderia ambifaria]EDT41976.1 hypothetical protein BamMEX5DRAFT_2244 [Burkholderia ambifaria MEX-5]
MSEFELNRDYLKTLMDETVPKQQAVADDEYASRLAKLRIQKTRPCIILLSRPRNYTTTGIGSPPPRPQQLV